jgi:putative phosphonate metabolism protein
MRYAIYFTPPPQAPLTEAAVRWLGRDAFSDGETTPAASSGLTAEEILAATAEPRRYGFHATLKAPFRLAKGLSEAQLVAALEGFCAARAPFAGPRLALKEPGGFVALMPAEPSPDLDRLAADVVEAFDPFRAPLTDAEVARRRPERLTLAQRANLERWGYPYVFGEFRFHMTLTNALPDEERPRFIGALRVRFAPLLDAPLPVEGLALFREPEPGVPFAVRSLARFGSAAAG